jgi:hypothetical protein
MKKLLVVLLVVGTAVAAWRWRSGSSESEAIDDKLVFDRLWVDHMPRNDKDTIQIFAAITDEPIGIFQETSVWKGAFELFRYESHDGEIRMVFPQSNEKNKVKAKARACSDKRDMDYCLELTGTNRGVKKYYSRKGWEIDGNHMQDRIESMLRALPTED